MPLLWIRKSKPTEQEASTIPPGVRLARQPVMNKTEAELYNLLRLAVQDDYLLLAQVPVWCVVELQAADQAAYRALLSRIALRRVDFVLAHPGTLTAEKVVELVKPGTVKPTPRDRLLQAVFKQAGIEHIRIPLRAYSLAELTSVLGFPAVD